MVKVYDVKEWQELTWFNSGGTRAKRILQSNDGMEWYFKSSERKPAINGKPEKYYKYEFWSEIIAYQLGCFYDLNILRYDVGFYNDQIGCLSRKMVDSEREQLVEIGRFMTIQNPQFVPDNYALRKEYSYQLLKETLQSFHLNSYTNLFLKTILFDAIIGNTDRHQENWAFICNSSLDSEKIRKIVVKEPEYVKLQSISPKEIDANSLEAMYQRVKLKAIDILKMAPIYDSGSSLGRELSHEKVTNLLKNKANLKRYIDKGACEIHWDRKKLTHFDFITRLMESEHRTKILKEGMFLKKAPDDFVKDLLSKVDQGLPDHLKTYCIPTERKELIFKLVTLRAQRLRKLIYG